MARFFYKAVTSDGEVVEGELEAPTRQEVIDRLHGLGHVPIRAVERGAAVERRAVTGFSLRRNRVRRKDIVLLTRELATLLDAGLVLERGLGVLVDLASNEACRALVEEIRDKVRGGSSFADALAEKREYFPNYYVGMIRAGEAGGTLDKVLNRLADAMDRAESLRNNVVSSMIYPCLVLVMAIAAIAILMIWVIPQFRPLFADVGAALPVATQFILWFSDFLAAYWWLLFGILVLVIFALRQWFATPAGRMARDRWLLDLPALGGIFREVETARFSRTLGTLLLNGVGMLSAMKLASETLGNQVAADSLALAEKRLAKGEGLAEPLTRSGVFPTMALQLIQVGEETGKLEEMLIRIADIYDEEVKRSLNRIVSLIVPLITIVLGLFIALIIVSMMSGILSTYDLAF
jgi:general secretion pathway protein F